MPQFKFRFESLLRLRRHARQQQQSGLSAAIGRLGQVQQLMKRAEDESAQLEQTMRTAAQQDRLDVDRLLDGHRYHARLRAQMQQVAQAMDEAAREVERCRQRLVEADRQVKVLEKLHDRQLERHRQEQARQEIKRLDEAAARTSRNA